MRERAEPASFPRSAGADSFICRGCYYILDLTRGAPGLAPGGSFDAIPTDFRCPDCGTDKSKFRRHVSDASQAEGA